MPVYQMLKYFSNNIQNVPIRSTIRRSDLYYDHYPQNNEVGISLSYREEIYNLSYIIRGIIRWHIVMMVWYGSGW